MYGLAASQLLGIALAETAAAPTITTAPSLRRRGGPVHIGGINPGLISECVITT
jgi:hypothetical protein